MNAGRPAMTIAEIRQGFRDQDADLHWSHGWCWCKAVHCGDETGLRFVLPPWDPARTTGAAA